MTPDQIEALFAQIIGDARALYEQTFGIEPQFHNVMLSPLGWHLRISGYLTEPEISVTGRFAELPGKFAIACSSYSKLEDIAARAGLTTAELKAMVRQEAA